MDAFLFTLAIFSFWGLIGFAVVSVFNPRVRVMQGVLLSPALGIAATLLPVFFINRLGLPVKAFGGILLPALALMAVSILAITRPVFPVKRLVPYMGIIFAALALAAWPMFKYGFDWLSFSNDDMANYCLAAQRFLNHGFFDRPNLDDLLNGKDYSLAYWFMHAAGGVRSGSELTLAVIWAFSGMNAHQIFMPVIMALHLALIAGAGSMVVSVNKGHRTPMITMGLLALSPLTSLGALYQLIGQVGGLALLTAAVSLMYRPILTKNIFRLVRGGMPATLVFASLFIWYPEVMPFFGLGWILYSLLLVKYGMQSLRAILVPALIVGALVLLVLNRYVVAALIFMMGQASGGMQSAEVSTVLFPYFLVPSGIAAFWGIVPIASNIQEPFLSLGILIGLALLFWLGGKVLVQQISRAGPAASVLLIMLLMGGLLFYRNNDFGLFKLAMFAQPFLMAVIATDMGLLKGKGYNYKKIALSVMLLPLAISQYGYVEKSLGEALGGFNEVPYASVMKVNKQFQAVLQSIPLNEAQPPVLVLETSNIVLAKFQALYTRGWEAYFPVRSYFEQIFTFARSPDDLALAQETAQYSTKRIGENQFQSLKASGGGNAARVYISSSLKSDVFNAYSSKEGQGYFSFSENPSNRLRFIHSKLGNHYYFGDKKVTAFYSLEDDPMFPGQRFSALGRHLLFEAIGPSLRPRVVMELTATVVKQLGSELPRPNIGGVFVNFVGRGSGRVFSEPITPVEMDRAAYISLDMGRDGKPFPGSTKGLMRLYGKEFSADSRRITAFGRDISLVSERQYQEIQPPASLSVFPDGLADKGLEYSGIYEDGWISESSFFVLSPKPDSRFVTVAGTVPNISDPNFSSVLTLRVNGNVVGSQRLGLGSFEFKVPVPSLARKQRIELEFSNHQTLPGADGRISSARINFIGFQ